MASSQVGVLIPLNKSFEEDDSVPELPVFEGSNVVGRNNVPAADKRLSRKHCILSVSSAASDGLSDLLVEGMNPVVINSTGKRTILSSGEKAAFKSGDVIELIPGSYYFRYVTLSDQTKFTMAKKTRGGDCQRKIAGVGMKRTREEFNYEASVGHSMVQHKSEKEMKKEFSTIGINVNAKCKSLNASASSNNQEALRQFHISDDKLPLTFRLMKVRGLPGWANTSCVTIEDVIKGDVLVAVLSNYMVDIEWLLSGNFLALCNYDYAVFPFCFMRLIAASAEKVA